MTDIKHDELMLGFGHGFLGVAEQIIPEARELRLQYFPEVGLSLLTVHIIDHDYNDRKEIIPLEDNEYVIRILGEEQFRGTCQPENYREMIDSLRLVVQDNLLLLQGLV